MTDATWRDLQAPNRARMKIHGKAPGSVVDGGSEMVLSDGQKPGETVLDWSADVTVIGTIASLAARLMGPVTQKRPTHSSSACARKSKSVTVYRSSRTLTQARSEGASDDAERTAQPITPIDSASNLRNSPAPRSLHHRHAPGHDAIRCVADD